MKNNVSIHFTNGTTTEYEMTNRMSIRDDFVAYLKTGKQACRIYEVVQDGQYRNFVIDFTKVSSISSLQ